MPTRSIGRNRRPVVGRERADAERPADVTQADEHRQPQRHGADDADPHRLRSPPACPAAPTTSARRAGCRPPTWPATPARRSRGRCRPAARRPLPTDGCASGRRQVTARRDPTLPVVRDQLAAARRRRSATASGRAAMRQPARRSPAEQREDRARCGGPRAASRSAPTAGRRAGRTGRSRADRARAVRSSSHTSARPYWYVSVAVAALRTPVREHCRFIRRNGKPTAREAGGGSRAQRRRTSQRLAPGMPSLARSRLRGRTVEYRT